MKMNTKKKPAKPHKIRKNVHFWTFLLHLMGAERMAVEVSA